MDSLIWGKGDEERVEDSEEESEEEREDTEEINVEAENVDAEISSMAARIDGKIIIQRDSSDEETIAVLDKQDKQERELVE